ncbi:MAG: UDP-N-acetylmuramoyl-tripeptide--D-alanyl-D-alanine ligase, partial [Bowdeniella nasicola]|nr:UDP-N-acetylmuramoyl-tripeptide--D-alanyl-D-alanine ligase [Bowdeniella nasicola]
MIELRAKDIAAVTGGDLCEVDPNVSISGNVVIDSRDVRPGDIFVAIVGERVDGHDYGDQALQAGAALVIAERSIPSAHLRVANTVQALADLARHVVAEVREGGKLQVIGITGSAGKTTTKDLLAAICSQAGPTVAPVGSFNNDIGMPLTALRIDRDTEYLVCEMGASAKGELSRLTAIAPLDIACVLMVGHAHLQGFGSIDDVARAKAELLANVRGAVVLNADDPRVRAMAKLATAPSGQVLPRHRIKYFSATNQLRHLNGSDLAATDVITDAQGRSVFVASRGAEQVRVTLPMPGRHHVNNALAALTVATTLGIDLQRAATAISQARLSAHRMAVHRLGEVTLIDDAYNANPESMRAALATVAKMPAVRRVAVLGTMLEIGDQSAQLHYQVGKYAGDVGIDWVVAVAAPKIAQGAREAGVKRVDAV